MSDYETVLQSVKDWDISTKYNLLQELLQELYNKISDKREAKSAHNKVSNCEVKADSWVAIDDMELSAPVKWLTRQECHER